MVHLAEHALQQQRSGNQDPLGVYLRFLADPQITSQPVLLSSHLHKCANMYVDDDRYKNDNRYIQLWLRIADKPSVFRFMADHDIGIASPPFYAAYARSLASHGYLDLAKVVLRKGNTLCGSIAYSEQDLEHLAPKDRDATKEPIDEPLAEPLPYHGKAPQPKSAEEITVDLALLDGPRGGRSFEELLLEARKIGLSPIPRRPDPALVPPPRPVTQLSYSNYAPGTQQVPTQQPRPGSYPAYSAPPPKRRTPQPAPAPTPASPNQKVLQVVNFDELPTQELQLPPAQFTDCPPVVDASTTRVRRMFAKRIYETVKNMGPVFNVNQYERNGFAFLTKKGSLPGTLSLTNIDLTVRKTVGSGGYGTVFSAVNPVTSVRYALKCEKDTDIPWEWYTASMTRSRLRNTRAIKSIIRPYLYEGFLDEQYLLMPLIGYNSLLACANGIRSKMLSDADIELVTVYFSIELLRTVEELHKNRIVHGDIKSENVMIRAPADKSLHAGYLGRQYSPEGHNHWDEYGILLIDFGRAIDLDLFPPGQQFEARWEVDQEQDCTEIRQGKTWTYEVDYHGIANVAYMMLFGQYIKIQIGDDGVRRISTAFHRRDNALWQKFFHVMLNYPDRAKLPIVNEMAALREMLENWLSREASHRLHQLLTNIAYDERRKRLI